MQENRTNRFLNFHKVVRAANNKQEWTPEMKKSYVSVDEARERVQDLCSSLEEHLRNKWSQESPNYKEQAGYIEEIKLVKKLRRLEEDLYKTLFGVRDF